MAKRDDDDLPDFNEEFDTGAPGLPPGVYEADISTLSTYWADNPKIQGDALMFRAEVKIVEVINEVKLPADASADDKNLPPANVQAGELRMWQGKIGPKDKKTGKLNYACAKTAARVKELVQALLRFEPGGKLATTAVDEKGEAVNWNDLFKAAIGENNPFEAYPVRIAITRIKTDSGNHMQVPSFSVSSRVKARESNVLDSL